MSLPASLPTYYAGIYPYHYHFVGWSMTSDDSSKKNELRTDINYEPTKAFWCNWSCSNIFFASTSKKPQLSKDKLVSQISWTPWAAPSITAFNIGGFGYRDLQNTLCEKASPSFPDSNYVHARLLVKIYNTSRHKWTVGCPGRDKIGHPTNKMFNAGEDFFSVLSKF